MAQVLGSKAQLLIDFETTYNSDPAVAAGLEMPYNKFSMVGKQNKIKRSTIRNSRNQVKSLNGNLVVDGSIEVPVDWAAFAHWLKAMFGAPTTTGSGPYQHVFKVQDSMPSFLTVLKYATASSALQYAKCNGVKVGSWGMKISSDDSELVANLGLIGSTENFSASAYDADPTTFGDDAFENIQATIQEGGASTTVVDLDFSVNFGLAGRNAIGQPNIHSLTEGLVEVSGNLTAIFESMDLLNKAINSTETSLVITLTSGANILEIAMNELEFERNSPAIEGPQGVDITLPFNAFMDNDAAASVIVVTLTNNVESYA